MMTRMCCCLTRHLTHHSVSAIPPYSPATRPWAYPNWCVETIPVPLVPTMATMPPQLPDRYCHLVVAMMLVARVMVLRPRRIEMPGADQSCMAINVVVSQCCRSCPHCHRTPRRLCSVHWYVNNVHIDHCHPNNNTHHRTMQRFEVSPIGSGLASPRCAVPLST